MSQTIFFLPASTVKRLFNKTSIMVNHQATWQIFDKLAKGGTLTPIENQALWDFYLSIAIAVIAKCYPTQAVDYKPGTGTFTNQNQIDELMDLIEKMAAYYGADPQKRVIDHFPTCPMTESEERRFYSHFGGKAMRLWIDRLRKDINDPMRRILGKMNSSTVLPQNQSNNGMDGADSNPNDEVVSFDVGEKYQWDHIICSTPVKDWFASEALHTAFQTKYSNLLGVLLERSAIAKFIKGLREHDLIQNILPATFAESEYKVEVHPSDSFIDLVITGAAPFFYDSNDLKAGTGKAKSKIGIVTKFSPLDEKQLAQINIDIKNKQLDEVEIFTLKGEISEAAKESMGQNVRVWDLIDLARYIQEKFKTLPLATQKQLEKLIAEETKGF